MSAHLLLITIGPVQDFIAQARRTRDLWYGSHLLSELGRAAARAMVDGGARLIFPALNYNDPQLKHCLAPLRDDGSQPESIANKLLAELPEGVDPQYLARVTRKSVSDFWRDKIAAPVKAKCESLTAPNIDDIWNEQIDSFLEFSASWLPLNNNYADTRRQLQQAVAGRKLLRDFDVWTHWRGNVPKSSLDGARESVLWPPHQRDGTMAGRYRISEGEQLDAVGLVKRAGGEPDQFVPIANIAFGAWLARAKEVASAQLSALTEACRKAGVSRVERRDLPSRWRPVFQEQGLEHDPDSWGQQYVRPLLRELDEPYPYVACLVADGDHMGRAIDSMGSADMHRRFSTSLAGFSLEARSIIEQQHRGMLVYAGGDDVLAFLPLPEALACADSLRREFKRAMSTAGGSYAADNGPTLSVGLGIGHVMESMGDLLALGAQAERQAKRERNSLAILADKRSGGTHAWRARWDSNPVNTLNNAIALLGDRIPSRKIYEIASIITRLPAPDEADGSNKWARVLAFEVRRSLSRIEGSGQREDELGLLLDSNIGYAALREHVSQWTAQLLIARIFDRAAVRERLSREEAA